MLIKPKILGLLLAAGSAVLFGLWPSCVKAVYADGGNPSFAILMTTLARALAPYLFCAFAHKRVFQTRKDAALALRSGFFQAAALMTALGAVAYIPGPVVITICFTHTTILLLFLAWRGETKLDALSVTTTLTALLGLTFVLNVWSATGRLDPFGIALAFTSSVATFSRLYVFGQMMKSKHPAVVGAETFTFALLFVGIMLLFLPPHVPASMAGWGWVLLGSAAFACGTLGMLYSISLIGAFEFSLLSKMEPVFTAVFAVLLIHETLRPGQYAGMAAVVGSLAVYQYADYRRKRA